MNCESQPRLEMFQPQHQHHANVGKELSSTRRAKLLTFTMIARSRRGHWSRNPRPSLLRPHLPDIHDARTIETLLQPGRASSMQPRQDIVLETMSMSTTAEFRSSNDICPRSIAGSRVQTSPKIPIGATSMAVTPNMTKPMKAVFPRQLEG